MTAVGGLSPRRKDVLDALRRFVARHGRAPSMRELGTMLHLSKTTIFQHLQALTRIGLVDHVSGICAYTPHDGAAPCENCEREARRRVAAAVAACSAIARLHGASSAADEMDKTLEAANSTTNQETTDAAR